MYAALLQQTIPEVRGRIADALARSGRDARVGIVAVTKGHPAEAARAAIAAGLEILGENRVGELEEKVADVGRRAVEWHYVGHLQRNKVRRVLPLSDVIESIDSVRLARELSKEAVKAGLTARGLLQVNTSGEGTKGGFAPDDAVRGAERISGLEAIRLEGIMTMAPLTDDEDLLRSTFRGARQIFERCGREVEGFEARHLSMGMSNDYEIAVEEGSTLVRLGTVLFGERAR